MAEMLQIGLDNNDLLYAHLGDIADTKAEYYIYLENVLERYKLKYARKYYKEVNLADSLKAMGYWISSICCVGISRIGHDRFIKKASSIAEGSWQMWFPAMAA